MQKYVFSCEIAPVLHGYRLKKIEPDKNGFFDMVIGCIGIPTRGDIFYDTQSYVDAMRDEYARFNVCLRDGNLSGEYGHPVVEKKEDMPRLFRIDEHFKSHYFGKIWIDDQITFNGQVVQPIRALVKPTGPYGDTLEKELRDPTHNTAFSLRSLCVPMYEKDGIKYRRVQMVITYDAVHAPGFDVSSKRYVGGMESFEVSYDDVVRAIDYYKNQSMESLSMITERDLMKMFPDRNISLNGKHIASDTIGDRMILTSSGHIHDAAHLIY